MNAAATSPTVRDGPPVKIGEVRGDRLYATRGRTVGVTSADRGYESQGVLPPRSHPAWGSLRELATRPLPRRLLGPLVGWYATSNVWPVGERALLATEGREVYRSPDEGRSWERVLRLPSTSGPMGVLPTSLCEVDGVVYLAEYTLGQAPARIQRSDDGGVQWRVHLESNRFRHFHGVFDDPYSDRIWATTGDSDRQSAIGVLEGNRFRVVGGGSQRWRAVGLAFTPEWILWGMDCSYCDPIRVFRLSRASLDGGDPTPVVATAVDASVYYLQPFRVDGVPWVAVATAAETAPDSTAPADASRRRNRSARVLAASSERDFESWVEVCSFEKRRAPAEVLPRVPSANAYVHLAPRAGGGLVVNPYNTTRHHGSVIDLPEAWFERAGQPAWAGPLRAPASSRTG